jgi:hypothetical protein
MNKLCETKPNSKNPKMNLSPVITITNNYEQPTSNYLKQSQTNPIQSQFFICRKGYKAKSNPILPTALFDGFIRLRQIQKAGRIRNCEIKGSGYNNRVKILLKGGQR